MLVLPEIQAKPQNVMELEQLLEKG